MKIMSSGPITSWQIAGDQWKQWPTLFSWASKLLWIVTASMKWKDAYSLKESYDKPRQCIKKQRYHFADKGLYSQSYGFPSSHVWMWELDHKKGWTPKKLSTGTFELWCWKIPLRVPWTARWSNLSILKEINPEYPLEGLMLKLKLQYFGYLMQRADSLEKTLILRKTDGRRRTGWQRMPQTSRPIYMIPSDSPQCGYSSSRH